MRKLDLVELKPTRYADPEKMVDDYRAWMLGNVNRKKDFVDTVSFLRTAAMGRFLLMWFLCDLFEDLAIIKSGKQLITTVTPD